MTPPLKTQYNINTTNIGTIKYKNNLQNKVHSVTMKIRLSMGWMAKRLTYLLRELAPPAAGALAAPRQLSR